VLARRLPGRKVITGISIAIIVWGTVFIAVLAALDLDVTIPVFLVQGLTMAAAAVALVSVYQAQVARAAARVTGRSLPIRVGLAYPIARKFRTAMTLAMFAIVVLTLVYLSIISFMFSNQRDAITADASGGFGMVVTSNPTNPVTTQQLTSTPGVRAVAPLAYGQADFVAGSDLPKTWPLTGFGAELAAAPPALKDLGGYDSTAAAWSAVRTDPNLIIVDPFFLRSGGGPPNGLLKVGDPVTIIDPVSGNTRVLTVAALAKGDFVNSGAWYGMDGYQTLFGARAVPSRFYVASDDPTRVAATIRTAVLGNGADAESVHDRVAGILSQNTGFFTLMEQFVGVGLIVGIAGIGVLLVRAVRERRRDIGVLRSLGFQPGWVSRAFLVEAGFIAIEGVVIGIVVALIGSYGLVASGVDFAADFTWGVPWIEVAVIAAIALVTSAVVALWPAQRASHIRPAVALRTVD
jgi:putative ABC transport system permease protein